MAHFLYSLSLIFLFFEQPQMLHTPLPLQCVLQLRPHLMHSQLVLQHLNTQLSHLYHYRSRDISKHKRLSQTFNHVPLAWTPWKVLSTFRLLLQALKAILAAHHHALQRLLLYSRPFINQRRSVIFASGIAVLRLSILHFTIAISTRYSALFLSLPLSFFFPFNLWQSGVYTLFYTNLRPAILSFLINNGYAYCNTFPSLSSHLQSCIYVHWCLINNSGSTSATN